MKIIKRCTFLVLSICVFSLAGCNNNSTSEVNENNISNETTENESIDVALGDNKTKEKFNDKLYYYIEIDQTMHITKDKKIDESKLCYPEDKEGIKGPFEINLKYDDGANKDIWEYTNDLLEDDAKANIIEIYIDTPFKPRTCANLFEGFVNAFVLDWLDSIDTSECEDMSRMFYGFGDFQNVDLNRLDVSNVKNMESMFSNSNTMAIDVSRWNTLNVTEMSHMFSDCKNLTALNLSNFIITIGDIEKASNFIAGCENLKVLYTNSTILTMNAYDISLPPDFSIQDGRMEKVNNIFLDGIDDCTKTIDRTLRFLWKTYNMEEFDLMVISDNNTDILGRYYDLKDHYDEEGVHYCEIVIRDVNNYIYQVFVEDSEAQKLTSIRLGPLKYKTFSYFGTVLTINDLRYIANTYGGITGWKFEGDTAKVNRQVMEKYFEDNPTYQY